MKVNYLIYIFFILNFNNILTFDLEEECIHEVLDYDEVYLKRNPRQTLFVSLGGACLAALATHRLGLRTGAYPFDVIVSELSGVIKAIETDFAYFKDLRYLTRRLFQKQYSVYNSAYQFVFRHDLNPFTKINIKVNENLEEFREFQEKYQRRITRFKNLRFHKGKVFFLRTYTGYTISRDTHKNFLILKEIIKKKFPKLNFEILVINKSPTTFYHESIEGIKYFYINNLSLNSTDTDKEFIKIFDTLSIQIKKPLTKM